MEVRSGVRTTEFWVTVVLTFLGLAGPTLLNVYGSEESLPDWAKVTIQLAGVALAAAAALGYKVSRVVVKTAEIKAKGEVEKARVSGSGLSINTSLRAKETVTGKAHLGVLAFLVATALLLPAVGCESLTPKAYDPVTVGQVQATIVFETKDYDLSRKALQDAAASAGALVELEVRHDSELTRLEAWKSSEEAKKLPEDE